MVNKSTKKLLIDLGNYDYSQEVLELKKMYDYINQEKYLPNENKFNFMSGDPINYKPYPPIIKHLKRTLKRKDLFEYQLSNGNKKDKTIISDYLKNIGINANEDNITFTYSTTHAFNLIFDCLGKSGDGIIIPSPNYGLFDFIPERYGLKVIPLTLKEDDNWLINIEDFEKELKKFNSQNKDFKIKFFYNMNPHNPTGKVMSAKDTDIIKKIGELSLKYGFYVIDDMIYRDLTFDNSKMPKPFSSIESYFNNTISLFGISKSYNLASIRSGLIVSNNKISNMIQNKIYHQMDSLSIINIQSLVSAFNVNNKKQYKKYFSNLKIKYMYNFEILKYLIEGIETKSTFKLISKDKYIKIMKKYISKEDYNFALHDTSKLSFVSNLEDIESGYFSLLSIKSNKNYYELFDELFNKANIKVICGNSIMYPNNEEKIIRINFAVELNVLIMGIIELKKYLEKS